MRFFKIVTCIDILFSSIQNVWSLIWECFIWEISTFFQSESLEPVRDVISISIFDYILTILRIDIIFGEHVNSEIWWHFIIICYKIDFILDMIVFNFCF